MSFQSENERNKAVVDEFYQLEGPRRQGQALLDKLGIIHRLPR